MKKVSASKAKTHFGALIDQAQRGPVTIEKQGRPVAVIVSFETFSRQFESVPSAEDKKRAVQFLKKWAQRPALSNLEDLLQDDPRAQAIWEKYTA
jgi:prevent-host-death family protein